MRTDKIKFIRVKYTYSFCLLSVISSDICVQWDGRKIEQLLKVSFYWMFVEARDVNIEACISFDVHK